jgi:hypothetical protein
MVKEIGCRYSAGGVLITTFNPDDLDGAGLLTLVRGFFALGHKYGCIHSSRPSLLTLIR